MPPENAVNQETPLRSDAKGETHHNDSLFGEFAWFYILCREWIFRDDTERMIRTLWPSGGPAAGSTLLELGCGPGFYSRQMAYLFPQLDVLGMDRSSRQLQYARDKGSAAGLKNCRFERNDVLEATSADAKYDVAIASRLFTVLPEQERVVAEIFRVLRPGARCFIAEPRHAFWASIPLFILWVLAAVSGHAVDYREPKRATVMSPTELERIFKTQPWKSVRVWQEGRYQYVVCEKA